MPTLSQRLINELETNCGVSYHTDCIFFPLNTRIDLKKGW